MKYTVLGFLILGFLMIGVSYRLFFGQGDRVVWAVWAFFAGSAITVVASIWLIMLAFISI